MCSSAGWTTFVGSEEACSRRSAGIAEGSGSTLAENPSLRILGIYYLQAGSGSVIHANLLLFKKMSEAIKSN